MQNMVIVMTGPGCCGPNGKLITNHIKAVPFNLCLENKIAQKETILLTGAFQFGTTYEIACSFPMESG